ncbi:MAG: hypothetical protein JW827_08205 [Spirochaetes bacterium]|nr:hypothetical protein [Spirochaetota bacterium]
MIKKIQICSFLLLLMVISTCAKKEFGQSLKIEQFTPIEFLKRYPNNYLDKLIKVKGVVVEESSRGVWINIQDNIFVISVHFNDLTLPTMLSNMIITEGKLIKTRDGIFIQGKYLKIEN